MICFTSNAAVALLEPTILSYLNESKAYAETGQKPPKEKSELELPEELIDALNADSQLAEAFYNLTPGRQKSYVINLKGAKKSETKTARIIAFREKIIAGKGALDR